MTMLVVILFLLCIPICHAITVSRKGGARGCVGFTVFYLEATARKLDNAAQWLRSFHAWRESQKEAQGI